MSALVDASTIFLAIESGDRVGVIVGVKLGVICVGIDATVGNVSVSPDEVVINPMIVPIAIASEISSMSLGFSLDCFWFIALSINSVVMAILLV